MRNTDMTLMSGKEDGRKVSVVGGNTSQWRKRSTPKYRVVILGRKGLWTLRERRNAPSVDHFRFRVG